MRFKDKVIWITGAASGIGEALAYKSAEYGGKLILSDINETGLEKVAGRCREMKVEALALPLDLSNRESIEAAVKDALSHYGRVDVLINNGGISQRSLTVETSLDVDYKIMNINFFGAVILTKAGIAIHAEAREWGHCSYQQYYRKIRISSALCICCIQTCGPGIF